MNGFVTLPPSWCCLKVVAAASLVPLVEAFAADQSEGGLARFFRALLTLESKETGTRRPQGLCRARRQDETFALVLDLFTQYPGGRGSVLLPCCSNGDAAPGPGHVSGCRYPMPMSMGTGLEINHGQLRTTCCGRADRQASGRGRTARLHQMPAQTSRDAP